MLNFLAGHTYTIKLKWTNADGTMAAPPATKGVVSYSNLLTAVLVDPATLQVVVGGTAGVSGVLVQSPDRMSIACEIIQVATPPVPTPAAISFDENSVVQTA